MASAPEGTPNSSEESSKGQKSSNKSSPPSSSPSTFSSPPPKSPSPSQESPAPPRQSSSPPPKKSPSSPPPIQPQSPPPSSSPPPQNNKPASPPPTKTPTQSPPPTKTPTQSPPPTKTPTQSPPPTKTPTQSPPPTNTPAQSPPLTNTPTQSPPPTNTPSQSLPPKNIPTHSPLPLSPPSAATTIPTPTPTSTAATTTQGGAFFPPPPLSASSPSSTTTTKLSSSSHSSQNHPSASPNRHIVGSTWNIALTAGVAAACVLLIALIILTFGCLLKKLRKKKRGHYHVPPLRGREYYGTQNNPQGHVVQISPQMKGSPVGSWCGQPHMGGDGSWMQANQTSSEFSSNYSGPVPGQPVNCQSPNMAFGKSQFSYDELEAATGGFSQANLLGQGGFGYVHKGVLPNGEMVAVKSLKTGSGQGEKEFQAEVEIISRVHHRHLVSLVGYCVTDGKSLLVYEYVPNKTMEFHLHGKGQPVMDWATRHRIALGSAKGLAYLHEDCHPKIIHRDIKAANILLDDKFEAMVADFGLAKLSADNNTHVSTRVMGTFGYLAPEYASTGKLTDKSDVFSFGVMLLELITGRLPVYRSSQFKEESLVDWARPILTKAIQEGNYKELVDPRLEENFVTDEMTHMVACAAACIRHSAKRRPKMIQVVRALEGDSSLDDLNYGGKTGGQGVSWNGSTQIYDTTAYNADILKFRKMIMSSDEFPASPENEYAESSSSSDSGDVGIYSGKQRQNL